MTKKLSIIIPVRDEGINLKMMLKFLKASIEIPHELLIVYDKDDDNSLPVVEEAQEHYSGLRAVKNTFGAGVPNALRFGFSAAKGDIILVLTADDMGPVLTVEPMLDLINKGYDLVCATRYSKGGRYLGGVFISHCLSRLANKIFSSVARTSTSDMTLGIKMFRRSILEKITLEAKAGWSIAFELAIKAELENFKVTETPIISINRFYGGESSFKLGSWVYEYTQWFCWGLKEFYKRKKLRFQSGENKKIVKEVSS